jgi:excisionase family DNA binding protein
VPEPAAPLTSSEAWLSLGPASALLGVDPDTLRRWADAGRVKSFATPGGHRRFARADIDRLQVARRYGRRSLAALGATPERFTRAYARSYRTAPPVPRSGAVDDVSREAFRDEGRRLVETLLAYLDAPDGPRKPEIEAEANAIVNLTARRLVQAGADPVAATGAFVTARGPFLAALESLGRRRSLDAPTLMGLYAEAAALLDRLLLHFVATFHRIAAEG